jgi:ElaB/YqjD/DUF883 family membrane-anchored ribosome-binding protein
LKSHVTIQATQPAWILCADLYIAIHGGNTMTQTLVEKAGEQFAQSVREASRVTSAVAEAVADGVGAAKRAAKQSGDAAEEFVQDTTRRIERNPMATVAATLIVGFGMGMLTGMCMRRR